MAIEHASAQVARKTWGAPISSLGATKAQAQKYLLTNWTIIEKMARHALATEAFEDGEIRLALV
jgi:hypothetical protein